MLADNYHKYSDIRDKYMVCFFAGGETRDDRFNIFTGSFIRLMKLILENDFGFIRGIYYKSPMMNVIWALNNAQKPIVNPEKQKITIAAFRQIIATGLSPETQLVITSSSTGSIIAAQTPCYLAEKNRNNIYFRKPFHLVLGSSMISPGSDLFRQLIHYQKEGIIGTIIHDEVQDEGDNSAGIGGLSRFEAYNNAFGLMFPLFSSKFKGPSFLNTHPETGHFHRKRFKTVQKAIDYINVILIKNKLAGSHFMEKAVAVITSTHSGVGPNDVYNTPDVTGAINL
ncbi:MAG: hypothetical protein NTV31_12120 [Bacteroidia bacterium]|nr:hypothetical protein [Bacteroidia bacterium]